MIYRFKCNKCDKEVDLDIPLKEYDSNNLPKCEKCKKEMQRVYTASAIVTNDGFKG